MNIRRPLLLGLMAFFCPFSVSARTPYTITDLGTLNARDGVVTAINDHGEVVGGDGHGFLWTDGKRIDLGSLPPLESEDDTTETAYGINNREQIVGASGGFGPLFMSGLQSVRGVIIRSRKARQLTGNGASFIPYAINDSGEIVGLNAYRGFFYAHGILIQLGTLSTVPAGNRSVARGLNQLGQVVGWSTVNSPHRDQYNQLPTHGFLWQRGVSKNRMRDLGTLPGRVNSYAYGINRQGEIVGFATDATGNAATAFLWRGGVMVSLETLPGSKHCEAFGINNSTLIAGICDSRAVVWRLGKITDLNTCLPPASGWTLEQAQAINNRGQIAGTGTFHGQSHLFLLTPPVKTP